MLEETYRNETITVNAATDVEIAPEIYPPTIRKLLVITNTSTAAQVITLSIGGKEAVATEGIVLYAGGSWCETLDNRFLPTQSKIRAIASAIGGAVSIHERIVREG